MTEKTKPSVADLEKRVAELEAENEALRDAKEELVEEDVRVEVPKDRVFKVGKNEFVFAAVAECWWNSTKVKVADVLKDKKLLEEMVNAEFSLISKVAK